MNETGIGDLPVQVRTSGDESACNSVRGLAMQFLGKVTEFAKSQELAMHSNYFDLKEGGQIFAQYGPAGRQLIEITMPEGGAPLKEQLDMFGPSDLPDTIIESGCDCKNVLISCGEIDWENIASIKGRSGKEYEAMEGNYPHSYSLNVPAQPVLHFPIGAGDSPKISDVPKACAVYQNPGPEWGKNKALFFTVCEDEKNDKEGRYRPVMIPRKCKSCYYWKLDTALGDCDGQIYEGTDTPCGFGPSVIGKEEYDYRIAHKKMRQMLMSGDEEIPANSGELLSDVDSDGTPHAPGNDFTNTTQVNTLAEDAVPVEAVIKRLDYDITAADMSRLRGTKGSAVNVGDHLFAQTGYRAYYDLNCDEPDGTFVWYVPPKNEPRSRCEDKQTLELRCASDDKVIQTVEITVVYNREVWELHAIFGSFNFGHSYGAGRGDTEEFPPPCTKTAKHSVSASATKTVIERRGYIYATDSDGVVYHFQGWYKSLCHGALFGNEFPHSHPYSSGIGFFWWDEATAGYHVSGKDTATVQDWGNSIKEPFYMETGYWGCVTGVSTGAYCTPTEVLNGYKLHSPHNNVGGAGFYLSAEAITAHSDCSLTINVDCSPLGMAYEYATGSAASTRNPKTGVTISVSSYSWEYHEVSKSGSYDYSASDSNTDRSESGPDSYYDVLINAASFGSGLDYYTNQAIDTSIFGSGFSYIRANVFAGGRSWKPEGMEDDIPCE